MRPASVALCLGIVVLASAYTPTGAAQEPSVQREVPDYDGRGPAPEDPAEPWLWIPRILTGPLYLVSEFVLRRPIGWLLTELEAAGFLPSVVEYLNQDFAVLPTVLVDFGLVPSIGVYAFWNHFLFDANRIAVNAATGGSDLLNVQVRDTITIDVVSISARFQAIRRADHLFVGIGPSPTNTLATRSRFTLEKIEAALQIDWRIWQRTRLRVQSTYRRVGFEPSDFGGDPTLVERQVALEGGQLPAAFADGYEALVNRLELVFDTRDPRPHPQPGIRVAGYAEHGFDVRDPDERQWITYGGYLALSTDFLGNGRVLSLEYDVALAEDLTEGNRGIPFTELVEPGGAGPLPAYVQGHLRGASASAVTLRYEWPIWWALNGDLFFSIGSVFDDKFEHFDIGQARFSFGVGFSAVDAGDHPFVFQLAFGSETFENGAELTSLRLLIGARNLL